MTPEFSLFKIWSALSKHPLTTINMTLPCKKATIVCSNGKYYICSLGFSMYPIRFVKAKEGGVYILRWALVRQIPAQISCKSKPFTNQTVHTRHVYKLIYNANQSTSWIRYSRQSVVMQFFPQIDCAHRRESCWYWICVHLQKETINERWKDPNKKGRIKKW